VDPLVGEQARKVTVVSELQSRWCVFVLTVVVSSAAALAQATDGPEAEPRPEAIAFTLDRSPIEGLRRSLEESVGLELGLGYTAVWQHASDVVEPQDDLLTGSFDFAGLWTLLESPELGNGRLGFLVEGGQIITHQDGEDLSANVGSAFGVNDDLDHTDLAVTELWWAQAFADETITLTVGKIDQTVYLDANRIANDETIQFLATPLVNNPAIAFPDNGFGVNLTWDVTERVYLTGGWGNSVARANETTVNNLDADDSFWAGEVGLTLGDAPRAGTYRFIGWASEADDAEDAGFAVSVDHEVADGLVPFFRFGVSDGEVAAFEKFVSGGVGVEAPFGRADDLVALGVAWGEAADGDETLVEAFYRVTINPLIAVTPDVQWVHNPVDAEESDVFIVGTRLQLTF